MMHGILFSLYGNFHDKIQALRWRQLQLYGNQAELGELCVYNEFIGQKPVKMK
jgi:hypothetical protein